MTDNNTQATRVDAVDQAQDDAVDKAFDNALMCSKGSNKTSAGCGFIAGVVTMAACWSTGGAAVAVPAGSGVSVLCGLMTKSTTHQLALMKEERDRKRAQERRAQEEQESEQTPLMRPQSRNDSVITEQPGAEQPSSTHTSRIAKTASIAK